MVSSTALSTIIASFNFVGSQLFVTEPLSHPIILYIYLYNSLQFITILYIIPVGKWMPSTTASSMAQLIMVPDSSYLDPPPRHTWFFSPSLQLVCLFLSANLRGRDLSDFLQSLKMCRSCLFPIRRSAAWNGLSAWSRSSADLFDSSMLSRSAASLSRALLHRNWPKMQSCCNIQQLRPFSIFRCARDSELAWSKHFCLLLTPSSIVSFSPSSQDALVVAYLLPMVAINPESSINTLTSMKLLSSSHSSPISFPHVSTESRFSLLREITGHHWTQTISDRMPRPWSTSSCALLWPGRWVCSQETAVRTGWWRQCRLVNPRHQIVISVIFPSGSGIGSFLHLGSDHLLQDFKSPHKGSRIIKVPSFQRLLCQRFARKYCGISIDGHWHCYTEVA